LIVAEALHDGAESNVRRLIDELGAAIRAVWSIEPRSAMLDSSAPRFDC
jgi:hypothetical protein